MQKVWICLNDCDFAKGAYKFLSKEHSIIYMTFLLG